MAFSVHSQVVRVHLCAMLVCECMHLKDGSKVVYEEYLYTRWERMERKARFKGLELTLCS